ncbi:hypothetical protein GCM10027564_31430 [Luteimonas notoginsengisoli]|jgi:hypothetical protein
MQERMESARYSRLNALACAIFVMPDKKQWLAAYARPNGCGRIIGNDTMFLVPQRSQPIRPEQHGTRQREANALRTTACRPGSALDAFHARTMVAPPNEGSLPRESP